MKKSLVTIALFYLIAILCSWMNINFGLFPKEIFKNICFGIFLGGTLIYIVVKNRVRLLAILRLTIFENVKRLLLQSATKRYDKVLIIVFSISIVLQIAAFFAASFVYELIDLDICRVGKDYLILVIAAIPSLIISLLTSVFTVHLHLKKDLLQYSNSDIYINGRVACLITVLTGTIGSIVFMGIALIDAWINSVASGWFLFIVFFLPISIACLCVIATAGLVLGTQICMNMIKKKM